MIYVSIFGVAHALVRHSRRGQVGPGNLGMQDHTLRHFCLTYHSLTFTCRNSRPPLDPQVHPGVRQQSLQVTMLHPLFRIPTLTCLGLQARRGLVKLFHSAFMQSGAPT